jgi:hypothetical protein
MTVRELMQQLDALTDAQKELQAYVWGCGCCGNMPISTVEQDTIGWWVGSEKVVKSVIVVSN